MNECQTKPVKSLRIGTKNFARFYVAVPIADKIGGKGGISFVDELYLRNFILY